MSRHDDPRHTPKPDPADPATGDPTAVQTASSMDLRLDESTGAVSAPSRPKLGLADGDSPDGLPDETGPEEAPSRKSLGNDATQLVPVPDASGGEPLTAQYALPAEASRPGDRDVGSEDTTLQYSGGAQDSVGLRQAAASQKGKPASGDPTRVMRDEPSLGVQMTQMMGVPAEAPSPPAAALPEQKATQPMVAQPRPQTPGTAKRAGGGTSRVWAGLLLGVLIGGVGWAAGAWVLEQRKTETLFQAASTAVKQAQARGVLLEYVAATERISLAQKRRPTDGSAMVARALMLCEGLYELGGGQPLAAYPAGGSNEPKAKTGAEGSSEKTAGDGAESWREAALLSARQTEGEVSQAAYAAQILAGLAQGDLKTAEKFLDRLRTKGAGPEGTSAGAGLLQLGPGWPEYLTSQVELLAGKETESLRSLAAAVEKNPRSLWVRRLAYQLMRSGAVEAATSKLAPLERDAEESCGLRVDQAFLKSKKAAPATQRRLLQGLSSMTHGPQSGPDECGQGERARAARLTAELTLVVDPTARSEARTVLKRAKALTASEDVLAGDELVELWLRTGDIKLAEEQARESLSRVPSRRRTRLLLAEALMRNRMGGEALSVLEPLLASGSADGEALLMKARAHLVQGDSLEAQKLAKQILSGSSGNSSETMRLKTGAHMVLARVSLLLSEPAAARRTMEPLIRELSGGGTTKEGPSLETQLDAQVLWAEILLSVRPAESSEARAFLESLLSRAPERVDGRLLLARLFRETGDLVQAEQQLHSALSMDDRHSGARRELAELLLLRGEASKAQGLYRELLQENQDAELVLAAARAERLAGAIGEALTVLDRVKRTTGEITSKHDELLLVEKARALIDADRCADAVALLKPTQADLATLKRPALPALLIRAQLCAATNAGDKAKAVMLGRQLLSQLAPAWKTDVDVQLADCDLYLATGNAVAGRLGLSGLLNKLRTNQPGSIGEEAGLRAQVQKRLAKLGGMPGQPPAAPTAQPVP